MRKMDVTELLDWLAKKILWFALVPFFGYLGYYTQIRPYLVSNHGDYTTGFVDGVVFMLTVFIISLYVVAKLLGLGTAKDEEHDEKELLFVR